MAETSTRAVERALILLAVICEQGTMSLAECARAASLPASTALRLLRTLEQTGFVRRGEDSLFGPGARTIQVGAQALSRESVVALCRGHLEMIAQATGESTYLSMRGHGRTLIYVDIVEGTHSVRHTSWVGRAIPLEGTAVGAVFTTDASADDYVAVRGGLERDVTAVAVPVRSPQRTVAALSVVIPDYRAGREVIDAAGALLRRAATEVSRELGAVPGKPSPLLQAARPPA